MSLEPHGKRPDCQVELVSVHALEHRQRLHHLFYEAVLIVRFLLFARVGPKALPQLVPVVSLLYFLVEKTSLEAALHINEHC